NSEWSQGRCKYRQERGSQDRITLVTLSNSGNSDKNHPELYDMTSRYFINGNTTETTKGSVTQNKDWKGISYDKGIPSLNGEYYSPDAKNFYGDNVVHVTISGKSCVKIKMDTPAPTGEVTTHSAAESFSKVLVYSGASLYRDEIDARYMEEAKTGTSQVQGKHHQFAWHHRQGIRCKRLHRGKLRKGHSPCRLRHR
ncbi:pectate lyase, partial [human gut metagenome]